MHTTTPPALIPYSDRSLGCPDLEAFGQWLEAHPDFHALPAETIRRRRAEPVCRFWYHKPPGRGFVPSAGLAFERPPMGGWIVHLTGADPERVARALQPLVVLPELAEVRS